MQLFRQRAILAKIEVTEGTDPTPTGAANAILCGNITPVPQAGAFVDRQLADPFFGAWGQKGVNFHQTVQFDVELAGSGGAGVAPKYGPLLRACGLSETIVDTTSVAYAPVSSGFESVTLYVNESGTLHKLTGARGTVDFTFPKDDIPRMRFSMTGRWVAASAAALPSMTYTDWQEPLPVGKVNTPTFTLHSYPAVMESLSLQMGANVVHRDRPNAEYVALTDRIASGSVAIENPALGTKDYQAICKAGTLGALNLVHGLAGGNIVTLAAPKLQLMTPQYSDVDGVRILTMATRAVRDSGNDEFSLTLT